LLDLLDHKYAISMSSSLEQPQAQNNQATDLSNLVINLEKFIDKYIRNIAKQSIAIAFTTIEHSDTPNARTATAQAVITLAEAQVKEMEELRGTIKKADHNALKGSDITAYVHKQEDDMIKKCRVFGFNLMRLLNKVDDGASAGALER
jgi:hypothetical protein